MRSRLRALIFACALGLLLGGCELIVDFDRSKIDGGVDGAGGSDDGPSTGDGGADAAVVEGAGS